MKKVSKKALIEANDCWREKIEDYLAMSLERLNYDKEEARNLIYDLTNEVMYTLATNRTVANMDMIINVEKFLQEKNLPELAREFHQRYHEDYNFGTYELNSLRSNWYEYLPITGEDKERNEKKIRCTALMRIGVCVSHYYTPFSDQVVHKF